MNILHTLPRHQAQLMRLLNQCGTPDMETSKYIIVAIDGPESINRQASYASDFNPEDTAKIMRAVADQCDL